jgi:hypothetical protein
VARKFGKDFRRLVIVVLLCDVFLLYSSVASDGLVRDADIWGHFRTGQWIFSHARCL